MASDPSGTPTKAPGFAERIKQLTGVVAALTAFVAGLTALAVAAKAGWSEVGPYFGNLLQHGEVTIPDAPAQTKTRTASLDPALLLALEAPTHDARDQARRALANAIGKAAPDSVDGLIDRLSGSASYRTQLGIAVALQETPGGWPSVNPASAVARLRAIRTKDGTLRAALEGAAGAARR